MVSRYYDGVAAVYTRYREPDPRLAARLDQPLAGSRRVLNVGAGTGSYEPSKQDVIAVDASFEMLRSRGAGAAVHARAEALPFESDEFDAALAVLTVHHWDDPLAGLAEMRRVTRGAVVVLTWDPEHAGFWLVQDYLPEILRIDRQIFPPLDVFRAALGAVEVTPVEIPSDCTDGFLGAYWKRPSAYLDERVRSAISTFDKIDCTAGLLKLQQELDAGTWARRNRAQANLIELDLGYRLVVCA
ncbi:MAG: class I SAM-dependent methyltransferase [Pseudomonadota bacterium]